MELVYKQAQPDDLNLGLALLKSAAEAIQVKVSGHWEMWLAPVQEKIDWIKEGFDNGEVYFVENKKGELVGMFRLLMEDLLYWGVQEHKAGYIHSLLIKKEFSGMELGKKVIMDVEMKLIKQGIRLLRLDCNAANQWLCNYYEQQGFVRVGEKQMPHSLNNLYEKNIMSENITVKFISAAEVLPLRSKVLRNGLPMDQCIFNTDVLGFHLGVTEGNRIVGVGTFFSEDYPEMGAMGYRLRGMATDPDFVGKGYGARLIKFAKDDLSAKGTAYLWCNARKSAVDFYKKMGFEIISEEFEVPGIGPHFNMSVNLNK